MNIECGLWETANGSRVIVDRMKTYGTGLQAVFLATGEIHTLADGYAHPGPTNLGWDSEGRVMTMRRDGEPLNLVHRIGACSSRNVGTAAA